MSLLTASTAITPTSLPIDFATLSSLLKKVGGLDLNHDQIKRIVDISKEAVAAEKDFQNIPMNSERLLTRFKIQLFTNTEKQRARIYISTQNPNELHVTPETGTSKRFSETCCLKIKFQSEMLKETKVTRAARLRINFDSYLMESASENLFADWKKEIELLKRLKKKPNICTLKDSAEYEGRHHKTNQRKFVMYQKLYNQGDLYTFVGKRKEVLTNAVREKIIKDCLRAFSGVHHEGIYYVDGKPENIFIDEDAEGNFSAFLGDFGLSQEASQSENAIEQGTPDHWPQENITAIKDYYSLLKRFLQEPGKEASSPEELVKYGKAKLKGVIEQSSDIWALGSSLISLFTYESPLWSTFTSAWYNAFELQTILKTLEQTVLTYDDMTEDQAMEFDAEAYGEYLKLLGQFSENNEILKSLSTGLPSLVNYFEPPSKNLDRVLTGLYNFQKTTYENVKNLFEDILIDNSTQEKEFQKHLLSTLKPLIDVNLGLLTDILEKVWLQINTENRNDDNEKDTTKFVIRKMLQLDPKKRITADKGLALLEQNKG